MKLTLKFLTSAAAALILASVPALADVPADIQNNPNLAVINTLLENGVTGCRSEGRFRPDADLTRGEAAEMAVNMADVNAAGAVSGNPTVTAAVQRAVDEGYVPVDWLWTMDRAVTRLEFADMLYAYLSRQPYFGGVCQYLPDAPYDVDPAPGCIVSWNAMSVYGDGRFHPEDTVSRGDACYSVCAMTDLPISDVRDSLPSYNLIPTPYVSQLYPVYAVVGCEGASLLMGLKAKGYCQDMGLREFLDNMPKHSSNPAKGYVGSPYRAGQYSLRTTIYPAPLAQYASQYGKVLDISGSSPGELQAEILSGNPVVAYATLYWEPARYRDYDIEGETVSLLRNNHVVLVNGYDRATGSYHISDPYNEYDTHSEYGYWIDGETFERIYNIRRHALVVE